MAKNGLRYLVADINEKNRDFYSPNNWLTKKVSL